MIIYPKHIRCIQIRQNGTGTASPGSQPYRSFFIEKIEGVKCKQNRLGGGDFELTLPYNARNKELFSQLETVPTFIAMSFFLDGPWDTTTKSSIPHPMPMVVETYNEKHDILERKHTIVISGRGVLDVILSNKVVMPKITYRNPENANPYDEGLAFPPWDIAVDLFGRNVNGDLTPKDKFNTIGDPNPYLLSTDPSLDERFIPDVSLLSDAEYRTGDHRVERAYDGDSLLDVITSLVNLSNMCITGQMNIDEKGHLHFDYTIRRLVDLRVNTAMPLIYDYGAMPPRSYDKLLSTQELRQVVYVKMPPHNLETVGAYQTVTKGTAEQNATYFGWVRKELYVDGSSLPINETATESYLNMLTMSAADALYADGAVLINIEDIEYFYTPMRYYQNGWPGCIYTSIGPDGESSSLLIESLVLTGSNTEGWVITPELSHYTDPYIPE